LIGVPLRAGSPTVSEPRFTIAVDAMGGDHGCSVCVPAAFDVLAQERDVAVVLVGQPDQIDLYMPRGHAFSDRVAVQPASQQVEMNERPQEALRKKKDSSMRVALDLVKSNRAHACVSAGNTGALMATSRFVLKTIDGIDRPAILSRIPSAQGFTHMLDLGANAECSAEHLLQFAVMGSVVAQQAFGLAKPRVGLLNIGEEDIKGDEVVQEAGRLLAGSTLNYIGFVEGDDIFIGNVDVVVTDGFTGNVALKTMEGLAHMLAARIKAEFTRNTFRKLGALASYPALKSLRAGLDTRSYNGASMVGLKGIVVKSHGSADKLAFGNAIRVAASEARSGVPQKIAQILETLHREAPAPALSVAGDRMDSSASS
jgi:phosphate acyltransferase